MAVQARLAVRRDKQAVLKDPQAVKVNPRARLAVRSRAPAVSQEVATKALVARQGQQVRKVPTVVRRRRWAEVPQAARMVSQARLEVQAVLLVRLAEPPVRRATGRLPVDKATVLPEVTVQVLPVHPEVLSRLREQVAIQPAEQGVLQVQTLPVRLAAVQGQVRQAKLAVRARARRRALGPMLQAAMVSKAVRAALVAARAQTVSLATAVRT